MKSLQETFGALLEAIPRESQLANQLKGIVSAKIVQSRMDKGMTQRQLSEKLGLKQPCLSKWENGQQNFTIEQICKICVLLDIEYKDIFQMNSPIVEDAPPVYYFAPHMTKLKAVEEDIKWLNYAS